VSTSAIDFENVLLQQIAAGDEIAFGDLFHAWRDKLYFYILRITNSSETAEDVLQDVFCKLWIKRSDLSEVNNFGAYLFRMAHNHAISGMRRMAQETIILSELRREALSSGLPIDETLLCKQVQEKLKQIVDQLPRQQRLVYTLSREQGLKQEEIALQLDITVSTVQNHMTQALRNIRKQLIHFFPEIAYQIIIAFTILIND
jgi:RNA polymerase sigma-70 factor (family 1)